MNYYFSKHIENASFNEVVEKVTEALKSQGFGVLTEINIRETMKKKLDVDFRPYVILGACNPPYALKALEAEDHIGTMLPCNVIVQEKGNGIEVAAVDPVASMQAIDNSDLAVIAEEIRSRLNHVINSL